MEDNGVGFAAHLLGELSAFLIAHVAGSGSHHTRHGKLLHVFAHINPYQGVVRTEQVTGQLLGQVRLTHTRGTQEHERADGAVGVLQAHTAAHDGLHQLFDGHILADNLLLEFVLHAGQLQPFGLRHALHRHTRHHGYDIGNFLFVHRLTLLLIGPPSQPSSAPVAP